MVVSQPHRDMFMLSTDVASLRHKDKMLYMFVSGSSDRIKFSDNSDFAKVIILRDPKPFILLKSFFKDLDKVKPIVIHLEYASLAHKEMIITMASRFLYTFPKYVQKKRQVQHLIYDTPKNEIIVKDILLRHQCSVFARDIINEPANVATPKYICDYVKKQFEKYKNTMVDIYNEQKLKSMGLNLIKAVGQGSEKPPYMLVIEHFAGRKDDHKTICLCGKGVTFDAGGTNIKTGKSNSYTMKGDKTGGCVVIGMMKYFAETSFPHKVIGVIPLVENVVSASASMPGDIIKSYSGKTVEILNTDAEGRLILADALSFCEKYKPTYIFDFATLTGWANNLHCDTSSIFFSPNKKLHTLIDEIGEAIGERTWGMPKWLDYMQYCKSQVADLKNNDLTVGFCTSGSGFMAAMFLAHFVPKHSLKNWVHFDICNNIDDHIMKANTMNLAIELIKRLL